jgi:mannosyltransferase OCH1-like enzyme
MGVSLDYLQEPFTPPLSALQQKALDFEQDVNVTELLQEMDQSLTYCGKIPRRIHVVCWTRDGSRKLALKQEVSLKTMHKVNPHWQIVVWSRERLRQWVPEHHMEAWTELRRSNRSGVIVDLSRYAVLAVDGGVYLDLDMYFKDPNTTLDSMLDCSRDVEFAYIYEGLRDRKRCLGNGGLVTATGANSIGFSQPPRIASAMLFLLCRGTARPCASLPRSAVSP